MFIKKSEKHVFFKKSYILVFYALSLSHTHTHISSMWIGYIYIYFKTLNWISMWIGYIYQNFKLDIDVDRLYISKSTKFLKIYNIRF